MKIIDAHMHFSNIVSFDDCARRLSGVDYSAAGYAAEVKACGIVRSVCMGLSENPPALFPDVGAPTPMTAGLAAISSAAISSSGAPAAAASGPVDRIAPDVHDSQADPLPPEMVMCLGVNPHTLSESAVDKMEKYVTAGSGARIVGIKIYAGYYYFDVNDPVYYPAYDFAEKHNLTVVVHSGDTYSERGKLMYSRPVSIDSLAVDRPGMRIVACHMSSPWIHEACEIACKNDNVYIDLSGLHIGDADYFIAKTANRLFMDRYRQALTVMDNYDKVLFGTDWPLAPMASYINFCKKLVPPGVYHKVFYENAVRAFNL